MQPPGPPAPEAKAPSPATWQLRAATVYISPSMRIAVVFDTPYAGWHHPDHERQMAKEVAAWNDDEPEMEYQIADALRERGHEVT